MAPASFFKFEEAAFERVLTFDVGEEDCVSAGEPMDMECSAVRTPFSLVAVLRAVRMFEHRANRERAFLPAPSAFEIGRVHDGSHDEAHAMHVSRIVGVVVAAARQSTTIC